MTKLIWLSDLHFTYQGLVLNHDPRARLDAALSQIFEHHADADFCVISGDMVNRGTTADYRALADQLASFTIPYFPMVGNHDDRAIFKQTLPLPKDTDHFIQYKIETESEIYLCLDTQKSGLDAGEFCDDRKRWLTEELNASSNKPTFLFMHHPPCGLGLPMQDSDRMEDGESLLDLLTLFENVKYLFIGHVHRPISGTMRGIPFSTMRSVLYQAPPPRPKWDWNSFAPSAETPAFGVVEIADGNVTLQFEDIRS